MGPIIEDLAEEYKNKAKVRKVNVESEQGLAEEYGIQSIPALILFKNGEAIERFVGVQSKDFLKDKIEAAIDTKNE